MSKILKDDVTADSFKIKVEAILERLEAYKDKPEFNLEILNNDLEKIALSNRPSLDELIKRGMLEELSYQIDDPQSSFNQSTQETFKASDISDMMFSDKMEKGSRTQYYMMDVDNENALTGIKYQEGDTFDKVYERVAESMRYFPEDVEITPKLEFTQYMKYGYDEVFDTLALDNEFEFSHVLEDYTIDRGNINRGDLKIIYNNLAEELGHDEYYPESEIADDISVARGTENKEVAFDDVEI